MINSVETIRQHTFDAFLSFYYNMGDGNFTPTTNTFYSEWIKAQNDYQKYMLVWCKQDKNYIPGIMKRRSVEASVAIYDRFEGGIVFERQEAQKRKENLNDRQIFDIVFNNLIADPFFAIQNKQYNATKEAYKKDYFVTTLDGYFAENLDDYSSKLSQEKYFSGLGKSENEKRLRETFELYSAYAKNEWGEIEKIRGKGKLIDKY
ncbi:MAG: glycoside hydrolase family protein [Alphaproteobacteria bacterium]